MMRSTADSVHIHNICHRLLSAVSGLLLLLSHRINQMHNLSLDHASPYPLVLSGDVVHFDRALCGLRQQTQVSVYQTPTHCFSFFSSVTMFMHARQLLIGSAIIGMAATMALFFLYVRPPISANDPCYFRATPLTLLRPSLCVSLHGYCGYAAAVALRAWWCATASQQCVLRFVYGQADTVD